MPEGDTLHRAAARLHAALAGRQLTCTDFRVPAYATVDLVGQYVLGARAIGKHLLLDIGPDPGGRAEAVVHSHFMMEGRWLVHPAGTRWGFPSHTARAVLRVRGGHAGEQELEAVGADLGELHVFTPVEAEGRVAHLGPDLLGKSAPGEPFRPGVWSGAEALARLRAAGDRAIGTVVLDQRVLAGIGNEYRAELLFLRGLAPWRTVSEVDAAGGLEPLLMLARRTMAANVGRPARVFTGVDRKGARHWVYGRAGRPCRRCHATVRVGELGKPLELGGLGDLGHLGDLGGSEDDADRFARKVFFCPQCQR